MYGEEGFDDIEGTVVDIVFPDLSDVVFKALDFWGDLGVNFHQVGFSIDY